MIRKLSLVCGTPKSSPGRCSTHLAANDDPIARHQDFLDVELHVGDGLGETIDDFERPCRIIARRDFSAESVDERR